MESRFGPVRIRNASREDHALITEVILSAYGQFSLSVPADFVEVFEEDVRRVQDDEEHAVFIVAEQSGSVVGTVTLYPDGAGYGASYGSFGWPGGWAAMRLLAVDPKNQGEGIGRALTLECLRRARTAGAKTMGLHTLPFMVVAQKIYEDMGFERMPGMDIQLAPGVTAMAYHRNLRGRSG